MKSLVFVTGNPYKLEVAKKSLSLIDIEVIQEKLDTPEIQSTEVEEIAAYSAKWAAEKLGKPVVTSDAGYYVHALKGFPGPFIKYVNGWLSTNEVLRMMEGKIDRSAEVRICVAYCTPSGKPETFTTSVPGKISMKADNETSSAYMIDRLFVPEGYDKVLSQFSTKEAVEFWSSREDYWKKLADYLVEESDEESTPEV